MFSAILKHSEFQKYFSNFSYLVAEKFCRIVLTLLTGIYMARYLGPEQYGLLNYAVSFVFLFLVLATQGFDLIVVKELVNFPQRRDELLGSAFGLRVFCVVLMLAFIILAITFTANDSLTNLMIFVIAIGLFFQAFNAIDYYFQARVASKYVALAHFLQVVLSSALKIFLVFNKVPLLWFACVYFFDYLIIALGLVFMYVRQGLSLKAWKFNAALARQIFMAGLPIMASSLVIAFYMRIDQVLIKWMLGNTSVGHYAAAVALCEGWYFIPIILTTSLFPAIISAKNQNGNLYYHRLQRFYDLVVVLSILICIITTIWGERVVTQLYGQAFAPAGEVLKIYIWASVFVFLSVTTEKWFLTENLQKYLLYRALFGGATNIILNLILIPAMGISGAAIAAVCAHAMTAYFGMAFFKKSRRNFFIVSKSFNLILGLKRIFNI